MAYVAGGSLAKLLEHEPKQPTNEVRRMVCEVADALAWAHQRGVVHRDIKPDNILLDRDSGRALVTDFGIARAMEAGARLTATGNAVGTPAYMSPEQAVGERAIDGRSDIYSLGVLAYQMLTGRVPFSAGNPMALLMKHVSESPKPIADLRPDTPKVLRDAVERALAKDPDDRWPSAGALREALNAGEAKAPWRPEQREPVRYPSPRPPSRPAHGVPSRGDASLPDAPRGLVMEPPHLVPLTPEQREDLRLWNGRINLLDRVKLFRPYLWWTVATIPMGMAAFAAGVDEMPPLVFAPLITGWFIRKTWRRALSLRKAGLKLRRVILMPLAKWVVPKPPAPPTQAQMEKLAPREVLQSPQGAAIRRAVEDKAAIVDILANLSKADRVMLPDVLPTVDALVERVASLAQAHGRLDASLDARFEQDLHDRIASAEKYAESPEGQRQLALLKRQKSTIDELHERRSALGRQIESAGVALRNLRLDLVKLRSSGLQSALGDVTSATQEARALSRDIGTVLDAADEVRSL